MATRYYHCSLYFFTTIATNLNCGKINKRINECSLALPVLLSTTIGVIAVVKSTGVTKQSNEVTSNEVTRNRVTWKKIKGLKISKSFKNAWNRLKQITGKKACLPRHGKVFRYVFDSLRPPISFLYTWYLAEERTRISFSFSYAKVFKITRKTVKV